MVRVPPHEMELVPDEKTVQAFHAVEPESRQTIHTVVVIRAQPFNRLTVGARAEVGVAGERSVGRTEYFAERAALELPEFFQHEPMVGFAHGGQRPRATISQVHAVEPEHDVSSRTVSGYLRGVGHPIGFAVRLRAIRYPFRFRFDFGVVYLVFVSHASYSVSPP